jgi:hypothetical protein
MKLVIEQTAGAENIVLYLHEGWFHFWKFNDD